MGKYHVLYNPISGSGNGKTKAMELEKLLEGELAFHDLTQVEDLKALLEEFGEEDLVIAGGDGTLNCFVNQLEGQKVSNRVYYYATGTGNDFLRDVAADQPEGIVQINEYLDNLPIVEVNGSRRFFLNGVGYGIDGYCCEVGDKLREQSDKPVNYAGIAIKGLLFHYKPTGAKVTVDGEVHTYKKAWLAPTMYGKYYGGGMIPASKQKRGNAEGTVSVMLIHDSGKLKTLMAFPSIFEGKIEEKTKIVDVFAGHDIRVEFTEPRALQIDGETILNVKEYHVISKG